MVSSHRPAWDRERAVQSRREQRRFRKAPSWPHLGHDTLKAHAIKIGTSNGERSRTGKTSHSPPRPDRSFLSGFRFGGCYIWKDMLADNELLRRYCVARSESAFAELVERHADLVYS